LIEHKFFIIYNRGMIKQRIGIPEEPPKGTNADEDLAVSSISRAANILVCLSHGLNTVTDISLQCKLSKSTVHRLLNMLKECRFTMYDALNHRYFLGPLITQLASNTGAAHQTLIICAASEMHSLSNITEETITLTSMVGLEFVRLGSVLSKHSLKVEEPEDDSNLKPFLPSGSLQKVLLSQLNDRDLKIALKSFTSWNAKHQGSLDMGRLLYQIDRIKELGYYVSYGERIPGCIGISAPVRNYMCPVTLSIMGPDTRIRPNLPQLTEHLLRSAGCISADIAELYI
jgi:DNA-binding IclR family transcriptional regulator